MVMQVYDVGDSYLRGIVEFNCEISPTPTMNW